MMRRLPLRGCPPSRARIAVACLLAALLFSMEARASDDSDDYGRALAAARSKDLPTALMHFRPLTTHESPYRQAALFAVGEYAILNNIQSEAIPALTALVRDYPESRYRVFALWYLMTLAEKLGKADIAKEYQQHIIGLRQHSFLFRKSKESSIRSPLNRTLRVVYYIDKVEFYADGERCAAISY